MDKITLNTFKEDNTTIREANLIKLSIKNDKNEELSLNHVRKQLSTYIEENKEKIENNLRLIATCLMGPTPGHDYAFVMGYLYCKWIEKLEKTEGKYLLEYTERKLGEEELRHLCADLLESNSDKAKEYAKKLRNGDIKPEDLSIYEH